MTSYMAVLEREGGRRAIERVLTRGISGPRVSQHPEDNRGAGQVSLLRGRESERNRLSISRIAAP